MSDTTYRLAINSVMATYDDLRLSYEQAEKIYVYWKLRDTTSDEHFFADWEEWDFEWMAFKRILDTEQFATYELYRHKRMNSLIDSMTELDNNLGSEIDYNKKVSNYYRTLLLPDLKEISLPALPLRNAIDIAKLSYLKSGYQQYLNDGTKAVLTQHFRLHRTYRPNLLRLSLLHQSHHYILPDVDGFRKYLHNPGKEMAEQLITKFELSCKTEKQLIDGKFHALQTFRMQEWSKVEGHDQGWIVEAPRPTPAIEWQNRMLSILLIDNSYYGLQSDLVEEGALFGC